MELFKKPKWLKPELDKPLYWVHIAILSFVVLYILKSFFNHDMLSFDMFWKLGVAIALADTAAHSLLQLD